MSWKKLGIELEQLDSDSATKRLAEVLAEEKFDPTIEERIVAAPIFNQIVRRAIKEGLMETKAPMTLDIKIGDWKSWSGPCIKDDDIPHSHHMIKIVDWIQTELAKKQVRVA